MTAFIVIVTNPFEPVASRSVHAVEAGITLGGLLQACGIAEDCWLDGPEILIGGMTVPVGIYAVRAIGDGEVVTVIRWPQGGGGGGGGGEQYLYQLHVIGQGEYAVEQIRIEDTPISSFEEVQTETVPPGSRVTLFEPDVVTAAEVAGQELVAPNLVIGG